MPSVMPGDHKVVYGYFNYTGDQQHKQIGCLVTKCMVRHNTKALFQSLITALIAECISLSHIDTIDTHKLALKGGCAFGCCGFSCATVLHQHSAIEVTLADKFSAIKQTFGSVICTHANNSCCAAVRVRPETIAFAGAVIHCIRPSLGGDHCGDTAATQGQPALSHIQCSESTHAANGEINTVTVTAHAGNGYQLRGHRPRG